MRSGEKTSHAMEYFIYLKYSMVMLTLPGKIWAATAGQQWTLIQGTCLGSEQVNVNYVWRKHDQKQVNVNYVWRKHDQKQVNINYVWRKHDQKQVNINYVWQKHDQKQVNINYVWRKHAQKQVNINYLDRNIHRRFSIRHSLTERLKTIYQWLLVLANNPNFIIIFSNVLEPQISQT